MSYEYTCPECGEPFSTDENCIGERALCPWCNKTVDLFESDVCDESEIVRIQCPHCRKIYERKLFSSDFLCKFCHKKIRNEQVDPDILEGNRNGKIWAGIGLAGLIATFFWGVAPMFSALLVIIAAIGVIFLLGSMLMKP